MTSEVSLIEPTHVSISLLNGVDKNLYSVILNLFGGESKYLGTMSTEFVSSSPSFAAAEAYAGISKFYAGIGAKVKIFESGKQVGEIDLNDILENPEKIQPEFYQSIALH